MLFYHPAFDIYHSIFRMLRILDSSPQNVFEIERLRIFDFYLLFPSELYKFKFPISLVKQKRQFKGENPYQQINDPKRIFFRLEPYQLCALKSLAAHQFIDGNLFFTDGKIRRTETALPNGLNEAVKVANTNSNAIVEFLTGPLLKIDLYGESGLKGRSDLFEYRYDITNSTTST
jgi:hypothetical protein